MWKAARQILLLSCAGFVLHSNAKNLAKINSIPFSDSRVKAYSEEMPIAKNDTVLLCLGCTENSAAINVMQNDSRCYADSFMVFMVQSAKTGSWSLKSDGEFKFTNSDGFQGIAVFNYKLVKIGNSDIFDQAQIIVMVKQDNDCDGVPDDLDFDDDNDGIPDIYDGITADFDNDGIFNYLDIDSDNDGIPDNIEGQPEGNYIEPRFSDTDGDGWDDAYDSDNGGTFFRLVDTDKDGTPDFIDLNSDNDEFSDINEGFDADFDTIPDIVASGIDSDSDGLDDSFDTTEGWTCPSNSVGCNVPLPDYNNDGIRDWRDAVGKKPVPGKENPQKEKTENVSVYPNPATDFITVEIPASYLESRLKLRIFNTSSTIIFAKNIQSTVNRINISALNPGIYFLKIDFHSHTFTHRLIVSK